VELADSFCFRVPRSRGIKFDMFISLEPSFSLAEGWRQFSTSHSAIPSSLSGDSLPRQDKLFCYGFLINFKFPPDQAAV
jgi:hypothetical protein